MHLKKFWIVVNEHSFEIGMIFFMRGSKQMPHKGPGKGHTKITNFHKFSKPEILSINGGFKV